MNKFEYLSKLKECLAVLPVRERNAALKYYNDLFKDAGEENEEAVIMSLGSPQMLAHKILTSGNGISDSLHQTKKGMSNIRRKMNGKQTTKAILMLIVTFPLWGTILLGITGIVIGIFVLAMLILMAVLVGGIVLVCTGLAHILKFLSVGLLLTGLGVALGSATFMLFMPVMNLTFWLIRKILNGCIKIFNMILKKTEARTR